MIHAPVVVTDKAAAAWLATAGIACRLITAPTSQDLSAATVVVVGQDWERLHGWRAAGHRFGALVLVDQGGPLAERVGLEPVMVVREPTAEAVATAVGLLGEGTSRGVVRFEVGTADLVRRQIARGDGVEGLTQREADLLAYLAARPHRDVGRDELQVQVWGHVRASDNTRAVDMAVARLRKKVEVDPNQPRHLLTSRGGGYRLVTDGPVLLRPHNVAARGRTFVGRAELVSAVRSALLPQALVTLLGPPGAGKTRLATEVALAERSGPWTGGVWWAELLPATDADGVSQSVALALGLSLLGARDPVLRLARGLAARGPTLLVLDNAEHVIDAVRHVVAVLRAQAPELTLLVTSQVALELAAERVVPIDALPPGEASDLFVSRAASLDVTIAPTPELVALLERLDHLPLAIELAAARIRTLSVDDLLAHLHERFRVLTRAPAGVDPRHATLHTAIAWAWDLLSEADQRALGALSVFRGGFTTEAALAVLGVDGLDRLDELVARSLVRRTAARFDLLDAIRAFAASHAPAELRETAHAAHAAWCAALSLAWMPQTTGGLAEVAIAVLEAEASNLDEAWTWLAGRDANQRTEVALALDAVLYLRGSTQRRVDLLTATLDDVARAEPTRAQGRLLYARGRALAHERPGPELFADLEQAAAVLQAVGDLDLCCRAHTELAHHLVRTGEAEASVARGRLAMAVTDAPIRNLAAIVVLRRESIREQGLVGHAERVTQAWAAIDGLIDADLLSEALSGLLLLESIARHAGDQVTLGAAHARMVRVCENLPDKNRKGIVMMSHARRIADECRYEEGLALLKEAAALLQQYGRPDAIDHCDSLMVAALSDTGDAAGALAQAARNRAIKEADGDRLALRYALLFEGVMALRNGDVDLCSACVAKVHALLAGTPWDNVSDSLAVLEAFEGLIRGDPAAVTRALAPFDTRRPTGSNLYEAPAVAALAARMAGDEAGARRHLDLYDALLVDNPVACRPDWVDLGTAMRHGDPALLTELAHGPRHVHSLVRLLGQVARRLANG